CWPESKRRYLTVNACHSELKRWIDGFFKGAASKGAASKGAASKGAASKGAASKGAASKGAATQYLQRYLDWKRYLKTHTFSLEGFLDQISIHWAQQHIT
nr:hypothetical protein [Endozoicomonas sp.]